MCAALSVMLLAAGCTTPASSAGSASVSPDLGKRITVSSKDYTENMLCGEIIARLLEQNLGFTVERKLNLGATMVVWEAMKKGDIQLYPEFTSSVLLNYFNMERIDDPVKCYETVRDKLKTDYQMSYLPFFGFKNNYGIAVSKKFSQEKGITKLSQLTPIASELTFGAEHDYYDRPDGYPGMEEAYGWKFKELKKVNVSLKYQAAGQGEIDVILVYTTDSQIIQEDLVVLEDDKNAFVTYFCAPLIRDDMLAKYPELKIELEKLAGTIDEAKMQQLNAKVDIDGKSLTEVADEFLIEKGLVKK